MSTLGKLKGRLRGISGPNKHEDGHETVSVADAKPGDTLNPSHVSSTKDSYTRQKTRNGKSNLKDVYESNTTVKDLVTGETSKQYTRQKTKVNKRGKNKTKLKKVFETYDSDGNLTYREKTKKKNKT